MKRVKIAVAALATMLCAANAMAVNIVGGDNVAMSYDGADYTVLSVTNDARLSVLEAGEIDVLLVGGGGGGGKSYEAGGGAGGGAGGFVYQKSIYVGVGDYDVIVGRGGQVEVNGGDTKAFGFTAYGGGHGARHRNQLAPGDGGSGGGGTAAFGSTGETSGQALHVADGNEGHDGALAVNYAGSGGGGGAGEAGHASVSYGGGGGGNGKVCSITGRAVWYAGGGAGTYGSENNGGWVVDEVTGDGKGGKGGGGNAGCAGVDGLGGGGGGDAKGGDGVVIVRLRRAAPPDSADFVLSGADETIVLSNGTASVFRNSGRLTVVGSGCVEMLLVGGGGGGGKAQTEGGGGGGGAGGVIHKESVYLTPGVYDIVVGAGGGVSTNGEDTTALGFTAHGGGCGANNRKYTNGGGGGSGGGGSAAYDGTPSEVGSALYAEELNLGFPGATSSHYRRPGGGGGAGGAGKSSLSTKAGGAGGVGVQCSITGTNVWYAGGGAGSHGAEGYTPDATDSTTGDGFGGLGGGGDANKPGEDGYGGGGGGGAKGGSGVVIIRTSKACYPEQYDDAEGGVKYRRNGYFIHEFRESGTFTMPAHAGMVDILLVGGGGGGGLSSTEGGGAGGGAGGFVFREAVFVGAGVHTIAVGDGGAVGANGGDSTAFGLVAHGGGNGARNRNQSPQAGSGGSGGGASAAFGTTGEIGPVGKALGTDGNLGHDGGSVPETAGGFRYRRPGGGGGAGEPGHESVKYGGGGGDGLLCNISGKEVWYAGGGAGTYGAEDKDGWTVDEATGDGRGGKGGGGNAGCSGTDGLGGGGGGDAKGGSGIVIIRYKANPSGFQLIFR